MVRWDWVTVDPRNILDYVMWELYCSHRTITDFGQWLFTDSSQRNSLHSECLPIREGTKEIIF